MTQNPNEPRQRIPPLNAPLTFFEDDSTESIAAKRLLQEAGVGPVFYTKGDVEPWHRKPLLLWGGGGLYQGLEEIRDLVKLFEFWARTAPKMVVFNQAP